jgi:HEAT repeat protein
MSERQLDLFSNVGEGVSQGSSQFMRQCPVSSEMDDEELIAAIPESSLADSCILAAEAGRRRLSAAVPALATLCRRFAGFGTHRAVPEQAAAFEGLAAIGGRDAAHAVSEMIERAVVQGPTLQIAVRSAARLGSLLSPDALRRLLRHAEPGIRAEACRCARPLPELISLLIDLLDDLDRTVVTSAAFALGRMGRIEARPILKSLLDDDPSEDVIDAVSSIADEECLVLLGRIARSNLALADAALNGLENVDDHRAITIVAAIRRLRSSRQNSTSDRAEAIGQRRARVFESPVGTSILSQVGQRN